MTLILPKVDISQSIIEGIEQPTVVVSGIPANSNVGDIITPAVNVTRSDGITPIENIAVDFFVNDVLGVYPLGDRQLTDVNGDASSNDGYYVASADMASDVDFIIVVRPKRI